MALQAYTTGTYMKKTIPIVLLLLIVCSPGCIFDSDDSSDNDAGGNGEIVSAGDYFPLILNAFWTRTSTIASNDGTDTETFTDTVTMASAFGAKSFYIIDSPDRHQQWFRIEGDIVYSVLSQYVPDKSLMKSAGYVTSEIQYLTFGVENGAAWDIFTDDTHEMTGLYRGLEDITVPAGTFEDCAAFELTDTVLENGEETGSSTTTVLWLGKGVGIVREEITEKEKHVQVAKTTTVLDIYDLSGATVETYNVAGYITDSSGNGVAGVDVVMADVGTYTTTGTGLYVFTGVPRGSYDIVPSKDGYIFGPEQITVKVFFDDVSGQNFTASVSGELLAETYFPTPNGTYYGYDSVTTFAGGVMDKSSQYTDAVTGATTYEGTNYIVYQRTDTVSGDLLGLVYLRLTDNTVWEYLYNSIFFNALELPVDKLDLSGVKEIPVFDFRRDIGEEWEIYTNTAVLSEGEFELIMTGSYLGQQDITVPAGTFSGCVKFSVLSEFTYVTGAGPLSVTTTGTAETFHWMAADVGTVKRETVVSSNGITVSTSVDELTAYDVPR